MVGAEWGDGKFPGAHRLWKASRFRMEKQNTGPRKLRYISKE